MAGICPVLCSLKSVFTYRTSSITLEVGRGHIVIPIWWSRQAGVSVIEGLAEITWLVSIRTTHPSKVFCPLGLSHATGRQMDRGLSPDSDAFRCVPLTRHSVSLNLTSSSVKGGTRMPITRGRGEESVSWGEIWKNGCLRSDSPSSLGKKGDSLGGSWGSYENQMRALSFFLSFVSSLLLSPNPSPPPWLLIQPVFFLPSSRRLSLLLRVQDT